MGCKDNKNKGQDDPSNSFGDLKVNESFKFETYKTIVASFTVIPASQEELPHVIKLYQDDPSAGGRMITSGQTNENFNLTVDFNIPERIETIYVENRNPQGIFEIVELFIDGNSISHTFNTNQLLNPDYSEEKVVIVDPGCGGDCDEMIEGTYTDLELEKNDYCVPEGSNLTITGQLKLTKRATLVICGTATINQFVITDNKRTQVYISESGVVTTSGDLNINSKLDIYSFGTYNISGNVNTSHPYRFYNYGIMSISGTVNNQSNQLRNEGTLSIAGNLNSSYSFKNYGTVNISGNLNNNSSLIYNSCTMVVTGNANINDICKNYGYLEVGNALTVNSSARLFCYNSALIKTRNIKLNGKLKGAGSSFSKIDISDACILNSGSRVENKMDICDINGIEVNDGFISSKVVYCETTIPQTACIPGSEGGTGTTDTDGDGVADVDDDYPEDAERAFNNYYPNQNEYGSLAFEDLWPGLGDYDFNDLVLDFQYQIVTNANNLIVDIIAKTHVKAAGASLNNGFGISIPVDPSNCESATGYVHALNNLNMNAKGYENGHSNNTVVIFYDAINTIYGSSMFNTIPGGNTVETDTLTVTIYFNNPQIEMGQEPYNPFIYVNQERGKEIHLIDNSPTDLADASYFDTGHDNSNEGTGRWYVTENNLPWVIEIPVSFDYPNEKIDILDAYLKFADWAISSGVIFNDWYLEEPGYRNDDNIYPGE